MSGPEKDPDSPAGGGHGDRGGEPAPQAGVLGNLPKRRPSVRSPRRAEARAKAGRGSRSETTPKTGATKQPRAKPQPEPQPSPAPGREAGAEPEHSHAADLEGLARGGIAIAGGAASLGLRIAGRAAAALRDAVERR
jgi:hypothetical protein